MSELYLIAHKVRGEPAFDVATRMTCAVCNTDESVKTLGSEPAPGCAECDQLGYWWIVPTSGHRAFPWWHRHIDIQADRVLFGEGSHWISEMPDVLPDHFVTKATPTRPAFLDALLAKAPKAAPLPKIARRGF